MHPKFTKSVGKAAKRLKKHGSVLVAKSIATPRFCQKLEQKLEQNIYRVDAEKDDNTGFTLLLLDKVKIVNVGYFSDNDYVENHNDYAENRNEDSASLTTNLSSAKTFGQTLDPSEFTVFTNGFNYDSDEEGAAAFTDHAVELLKKEPLQAHHLLNVLENEKERVESLNSENHQSYKDIALREIQFLRQQVLDILKDLGL